MIADNRPCELKLRRGCSQAKILYNYSYANSLVGGHVSTIDYRICECHQNKNIYISIYDAHTLASSYDVLH